MTQSSYPHLLVFVDGIGLANIGPDNPFSTTRTPALSRLLDGPLTSESVQNRDRVLLTGIDACLGVDGLPQSATGQTTLLTGINAQREIGHHVTALPGPQLRAILAEHSLFRRVVEAGGTTTFANPYSEPYLRALSEGKRRPSATTCAFGASGIPYRDESDLARDEAVTWDVCRDRFVEHATQSFNEITAKQAGKHLARLALNYDFTLYETFLTDLAGHGRFPAQDAVERVDGLIDGLLEARDDRLTVVVTSDHGNLEDVSTRSHTRNPIPLLAFGPGASAFSRVERLDEVAPRIVASCLA